MKELSYNAITALLLVSFANPVGIAFAQNKDAGSGDGSPNDPKSAIESTIRNYIEGWYEGDAARMDRALHDDLVKRIPVRNDDTGAIELRSVTKERMVELTEGGGGGTPGADYEIEVHHVYGNIASGVVRSKEYLDYVQLVQTADGWKIANILFRGHE